MAEEGMAIAGLELSSTRTRGNQPQTDINLPYRTLSAGADFDEYETETPFGIIPKQTLTRQGTIQQYKLVTFKENDPQNPKNWSKAYKWWCTMCIAAVTFSVAFASAVITPGIGEVSAEFGVSEEVALLSITLFVIGFGLGPLIFAPCSEIYGRKIVYVVTLGLAVIFIIPCAVAKNIETLLIFRAIDGIMFSAPITLVGGSLADMWRTEERGVPMAAFSAAPFIGPAMGPLIGGYLLEGRHGGWRWQYYSQIIICGVLYLLLVFTVPETYAPTLLAKRARQMRKETGDQTYVTEQDIERRPLAETMKLFLLRPIQLLFGESIVFLLSLYMSVLYGLLYMFFVAYPIIYQEGKGYSAGKTGLMFIPIAVGVLCSAALSPMVNKHYLKVAEKHGGNPPPEIRLIPMMFSCWFIPIGLFIFAWTSSPGVSWAGPAMGGFPVGFGFIFLYNSANNYLVDTYQHQAASALAAKTLLRSIWGACTVLFTTQMYHKLGYEWASSLLAFIALACCAIPFLFYTQGAKIRKHSKYAYSDPEFENKEQQAGNV